MKKTTKIKKLTVHKATLRVLAMNDLEHVAGGTGGIVEAEAVLEPLTARCFRR